MLTGHKDYAKLLDVKYNIALVFSHTTSLPVLVKHGSYQYCIPTNSLQIPDFL
jgi:hypothetical protein